MLLRPKNGIHTIGKDHCLTKQKNFLLFHSVFPLFWPLLVAFTMKYNFYHFYMGISAPAFKYEFSTIMGLATYIVQTLY